jgi:hypothetical protein
MERQARILHPDDPPPTYMNTRLDSGDHVWHGQWPLLKSEAVSVHQWTPEQQKLSNRKLVVRSLEKADADLASRARQMCVAPLSYCYISHY